MVNLVLDQSIENLWKEMSIENDGVDDAVQVYYDMEVT